MIQINASLQDIRGIGPKFLPKLKKLGLKTARDLLWHFPYRYEDWSEIVDIAALEPGDSKTVQGIIKKIETRNAWKRRMIITEAVIEDETGEVKAVWFNQPYIGKILRVGARANFAGKLVEKNGEFFLSNPTHELVGKNETKHTARLVPIYPETKGLTSKGIRFILKSVLDEMEPVTEFIPAEILEELEMPEINTALQWIHFPADMIESEKARRRFAFEELFLLQLRNLRQKIARAKDKAPKIEFEIDDIQKILETLPFELTKSQKDSLWEILKDISKDRPMNRLLQGDVGSGKTIVAGIAAIIAGKDYQASIMAPTEILARQHYKTITKFFPSFAGGIALIAGKECRVYYDKNLETEITKIKLLKEIAKGEIKIVIGTHSLIQKSVEFKNLGYVVVDEQHRFGVEQRDTLLRNPSSREMPHFLSMSATPIPRTLMITLFGDLDLSLINELPKGRKEILTKVVAPENRMKAYAFIRGQVRKEDQVFVICPRIESSTNNESSTNTQTDLSFAEKLQIDTKNVKEEYEKLSKKIFPDLKVAMLHGKMKSAEKEKVMKDFLEKKHDILVSTSVIEVGVDVPNATIIVIEGADRFGLAQLYQFKGRVGRGAKRSFCFLFTDSKTDKTKMRLESLVRAKNGFELAEYDLKMRGPGEFLGDAQTGLPDIAMRALQNPAILKETRDTAEKILPEDPELSNHPLLKQKLSEFQENIHLE